MNRRGFFQSLALLGAAAAAPGVFIPKFEPVRWKVIKPPQEVWYRLNPEYEKAPYELVFVSCLSGSIESHILPAEQTKPRYGWNPRFLDVEGKEYVPPFIEVRS